MSGPAGVMALVLAQITVGSAVLVWGAWPLWNEVKHGFYRLMGIILAVLGAVTWFTLRAAGTEAPVPLSMWLTAAATLLTVVSVMLFFTRQDVAARAVGVASLVPFVASLGVMATAADAALPVALFQMFAGAAFLGGVLVGMLLGHWYLTDRKLPRQSINRYATFLIGAVVAQTIAVLLAGFEPTQAGSTFNPILTSGGLANWIAIGMVITTGLIAFLIRAVLKGERATAVQSATGFFYLAVVCALVAGTATMVSFLPGA